VTPTRIVDDKTHKNSDLHTEPPAKLLSIDWSSVKLASEADALALWDKIAPTGGDFNEKLDELPNDVGRPLAIALLRSGNFRCMPQRPARDCLPVQFDVNPPADRAGLADPCLRRMLALWAIDQLEPEDVPSVLDAIRAIAAIPPPESQLLVAALKAVPETDNAHRLELLAIAWRAGQHDLASANVGSLDEPFMIDALTKHHIDGALEVLSAEGHRAIYLAVVNDEALGAKARASAITELVSVDDKLAPDLRAALVKATASRDCTVAASAARALEQRGEPKYLPKRPRTGKPDQMMRALCVLASYELLQRADETSLMRTFAPPKGLERITVAYDPLSEVDTDGDGDPHTQRSADLVPRDELVVPEIDDMARAMHRCTNTTCASDDREFRFGFKPVGGELYLYKLEVVERPPCPHT
jgi:hypothetical protein